MKLKFLLIFTINILFNNKLNYSINKFINCSLFMLNNSISNDDIFYKKYNITSELPRRFKYIHPLDMYPQIKKNEHLYKYSKTSLAADCYKEISEYSLVIGLMNQYMHYLNFHIRVGCGIVDSYHDGTNCGDALYLVDLLSNKSSLLTNKRNKRLKECLKLEFDKCKKIERFEKILIEESFLRKLIFEHEKLLTIRLISYELYCISELKDSKKSSIDCERIESESNILTDVLESISRKYFKKRLDTNKLDDLIFIS
ncbi:signal peptide-containing protein [Cryptosporidium hominis]